MSKVLCKKRHEMAQQRPTKDPTKAGDLKWSYKSAINEWRPKKS